MKHLNLARLEFTEKGFERKNRDGLLYGTVPVWSFYRSMEWYGHAVGEFFVVQIPGQIRPIRQNPRDERSPYILPLGSFNVVLPFRIVPAIHEQDGVLIFGEVRCEGRYIRVLEGEEHILVSKKTFFHSNRRIVFAAVLRNDQVIAVKCGSKDTESTVEMFTTGGQTSTDWAGYRNKMAEIWERRRYRQNWAKRGDVTREDAKHKIDEGEWKLV